METVGYVVEVLERGAWVERGAFLVGELYPTIDDAHEAALAQGKVYAGNDDGARLRHVRRESSPPPAPAPPVTITVRQADGAGGWVRFGGVAIEGDEDMVGRALLAMREYALEKHRAQQGRVKTTVMIQRGVDRPEEHWDGWEAEDEARNEAWRASQL